MILLDLEMGMTPVSTLVSVSGEFTLSHDEGDFKEGRYMVQAIKGPVFYSEKVNSLDKPLEITVYDNSEDVELNSRIGSLALYAYEGGLDLGVFYNLDNVGSPGKTLARSGPTFSFPLVAGGRNLEASTARGSMPLKQNLTIDGNMASMNYPLKPGRTQLMVRSTHDYSGDNEYVLDLLPQQDFMHVLVMPMGMKVEGKNLEFAGPDQKNGVDLYEFSREEGQNQLVIRISGKAPVRDQTAETSKAGSQQGHGDMEITNTPDRISPFRWYLVGGIILGFLLLASFAIRKP